MKHSLNPDERIVSAFVPQDPYAIAPTFTLPPQLAETHPRQNRATGEGERPHEQTEKDPGQQLTSAVLSGLGGSFPEGPPGPRSPAKTWSGSAAVPGLRNVKSFWPDSEAKHTS